LRQFGEPFPAAEMLVRNELESATAAEAEYRSDTEAGLSGRWPPNLLVAVAVGQSRASRSHPPRLSNE
jgi:hypothetical protein